MRPPDRKPRFLVAMVAALAVLGVTAPLTGTASAAADDAEQELRRIEKALDESEARERALARKAEALKAEITDIRRRSVAVAARMQALEGKMTALEDRLAQLTEVEKETTRDLAARRDELGVTLSALARLNRQPRGLLMANPGSLIDSLRSSLLLRAVVPPLQSDAEALAEQLTTLASLRAEIGNERRQLEATGEALRNDRETMGKLFARKSEAQAELAERRDKERARIEKLARESKDIQELIRRLTAEEKRRAEERREAEERARRARVAAEAAERAELARQQRQAEDRAQAEREKAERARAAQAEARSSQALEAQRERAREAEEAARRAQERQVAALPRDSEEGRQMMHGAGGGAAAPSIGAARPFSEARGSLPLPVSGQIVSQFGNNADPNRSKGIVIETRAKATVVSPYDGQIVFAGPFRHYGLLLIIAHGEGYHTLMAGLSRIDGSVGQELLAGEPVGLMESSGVSRPTLYLELRRQGTPINPLPWLATGQGKVSG